MVLEGKGDPYHGVLVSEDSLPSTVSSFVAQLKESLDVWEKEGKRGIWLKIPVKKHEFISPAIKCGFSIHHATPTHFQLTKWLPVSETSSLPEYAHHGVGAGGFVMNKEKKVLVVRESSGYATSIWKLPGGLVDKGERISDGAVREVFEETGIKTKYRSLAGFVEMPNGNFGATNLYYVAVCEPLTSEIKIQEREIAECKWMPVDEFLNLPYWKVTGWGALFRSAAEISNSMSEGWETRSLPIVPNRNANIYCKFPLQSSL